MDEKKTERKRFRPDETKKTFMNNMKKLLELKGVTQTEFAEAIGVSKQTVNSWFRGVCLPNSDKMDAIAEYFGVTRGALIDFLQADRWMPPHLMEYIRRLDRIGLQKLEERAAELLELQKMRPGE